MKWYHRWISPYESLCWPHLSFQQSLFHFPSRSVSSTSLPTVSLRSPFQESFSPPFQKRFSDFPSNNVTSNPSSNSVIPSTQPPLPTSHFLSSVTTCCPHLSSQLTANGVQPPRPAVPLPPHVSTAQVTNTQPTTTTCSPSTTRRVKSTGSAHPRSCCSTPWAPSKKHAPLV